MLDLSKVKSDPKALIDYLDKAEDEYEKGKSKLRVSGELQKEASEHPAWLGRLDEIRAELKALKNYYRGKADRTRGTLYREYLEQYSRALGKQDIEQYINSDKRWQKEDDLAQEIELLYNKFENLVEAFKSKGWAISHIVKLRVAGLEDALI